MIGGHHSRVQPTPASCLQSRAMRVSSPVLLCVIKLSRNGSDHRHVSRPGTSSWIWTGSEQGQIRCGSTHPQYPQLQRVP